MQYLKNQFTIFSLILISFLNLISCSKDSDLLSGYVVSKNEELQSVALLTNDTFFISPGQNTILMDVLNNDSFTTNSEVTVVSTSLPNYGEVKINEDNTLTYTSQNTSESEETISDTFTYTTEVVNEDETSTNHEGTVTVSITGKEVIYWKELFDKQWAKDEADAISKSKSGNINQRYYYLGYYIDGLSSMWQATGENYYLDTALSLIKNTINDAVPVGNGYLGWPTEDNKEWALWDSYYWRHVATLLKIMHKSPNLRLSGEYQNDYNLLLDFTEKNIWDRYEAKGSSSFYRSRTHMASHWARIGMEMYIITGKDKYKEVFDNISFGKIPGRPSNLRNQLFKSAKFPTAYLWDAEWGVKHNSSIQDTSHAGAIISFWVLAYENGMYWNIEDINSLVSTLENIVWVGNDRERSFTDLVDGTGGWDLPGRLHEWLPLCRYSQKLQDRLKTHYLDRNFDFYGSQYLGIAALNAKILSDGIAIYPEN